MVAVKGRIPKLVLYVGAALFGSPNIKILRKVAFQSKLCFMAESLSEHVCLNRNTPLFVNQIAGVL